MRPIIAVPATIALVVRAYKKKSLTTGGIIAAALTAAAHAYHPWNLPFALLVIFFLAGTRVTHVKEQIKATLTLRSTGSSGGEGPRTHVQVLANSLVASVLTILHARQLRARSSAYIDENTVNPENSMCYSWGGDILLVGIIANYAAVAADTFSSELGILSTGEPRLITSWTLRKVPRGTNGGVSLTGLLAGFFGSMIIVASSVMFIPFCTEHTAPTLGGGWPWTMMQRREFMGFLIIWGFLGSVLDSFLGGLFQRSVRDVRSGKIVEGDGGHRVLVTPGGQSIMRAEAKAIVENAGTVKDDSALEEKEGAMATGSGDKHRKSSFGDEKPSRVVESGWDLLDNNDVNFLMAVTMSISAMAVASWHWGVPVNEILAI